MTRTTTDSLYGRQLGDFTLRDCLDEGGFGAIYRCEQPLLGREAVVKVMHERVRADPDAIRRFAAEARLAARLKHPYAAHVYAYGIEEDGLVWIAMELVPGASLKQYIDDHGPMPLDEFVPFFERLAEVVHAAHEQGIVHRDLKPANVMMLDTSPKLLDFGVAKLLTDSGREAAGLSQVDEDRTQRTSTGGLTPRDAAIGTPAYSSPEIWLGNDIGPAVDIYALGIIAFEALTGRKPFRAETFLAFGALHCTGKIPRIGVSALDAVFQRALAKQPEDRYESAVEFAAALRGVLDGQRKRRAARRMGAWIGALMATVVFAGGVGRARYEQKIAEQRAADAAEMARATVLTAELEQGRAALLGGDMRGAQQHLGAAWQMGDHSRSTRFMYDRAMQPRRAELAKLTGRGRMWSASWSPDGRWIATTDDRGAQIWDATTYAPIVMLPHSDTVYAAVWTGRGELVTACGDGSVRIWNASKGDPVRELRLKGRSPRWYAIAVHDARVAAVDAKGTVAAVWNAEDGKVLTELPLRGSGWPSVAFSTDGRWLAASGGASAVVVETSTWRDAAELGEQIRAIAWDPTGPRLLAGDAAGIADLWSMPDGAPTARQQLGEAVTAVAFSADGRYAAIAGEDGTEQVIDVAAERVVSKGNHLHTHVSSIAFSADGAQIIASGYSGEAAIADARSGLRSAVLGGPRQPLGAARFSVDGKRVLAASWDGTARIWSATAPYRRWGASAIGTGYGLFGGVEPDSRYLAISTPGAATRVWDTAEDRLLAELPEVVGPGGGMPVPFPIVSAVGDRAAIARGMVVELYELPGGRLVGTTRHAAAVTALVFDGAALVSGSTDGAVLVTRSGETSVLTPRGGAGIAALAALASDRIAVADVSGRIRILDETGAPIAAFSSSGTTRMLRSSPDGRCLLVVPFHAGKAAPMALFDVVSGTVVQLDGPPVYAARWTAAGILSAHADGSARLWSAQGASRRTYTEGTEFLATADLSPDGSMVVGAGGDGMLRFWDVATGKPLWVVAAHKPYVMGLHFEGGDIVTRGIGGEVARWRIPP